MEMAQFTVRQKFKRRQRPLENLLSNENSWLIPKHQCTCWAKETWAQENWRLCRSTNPTTVVTANGEVQTDEAAQVYVHDLDLFGTVRILDHTLAVLSHRKPCEDNGFTYDWASGQKPRLTKEGKDFFLQHWKFRTRREVEQAPRELVRPASGSSSSSVSERSDELGSRRLVRGSNSSETSTPQDLSSTSPAQKRSDEPAPRRWCGSPSETQNKKWMAIEIWRTVCETLQNGWRSLQKISKKQKRLHPRAHFSWPRFGTSYKSGTQEAQCLYPLPKRPKLRRMLWEPKEQKPLAEDALTKHYHEQKSLVTWSRRITKFSVKDVNHGTITDTLSWYKILLLNGFSLIRTKRRFHTRRREVCENSWSRHTNQKLLNTDNSMEFGKTCEDLSWNHRTSTLHRSETNGIAERAVRQVKEGTSAVFLQSDLMKDGGPTLWNLLLSAKCPRPPGRWKTPCERRFGEPFTGPIIPFGSMVDFNARPLKISPTCTNLSWLWADRGRIVERMYSDCGYGRIG